MAKLGRWVDKLGRWVAKLSSAPDCYGSSLGSNPAISQKYKMGDKCRATLLPTHSSRPKNKTKKEDDGTVHEVFGKLEREYHGSPRVMTYDAVQRE